MIYSLDEFDNIQREAFNDTNEVDNINFQTGNKTRKLKLRRRFFRSSWYIWKVLGERLWIKETNRNGFVYYKNNANLEGNVDILKYNIMVL